MKKIYVIGLGYIGLPTSLMFAAHGASVVGIDYNKELVATLNAGQTTFKEDGLDDLFNDACSKDIRFTNEYESGDFYIIAVPTPYDSENKKIDATYVQKATLSVLDVCKKGTILVIESTISPGTIDRFIRPIIEEKGFIIGKDIHLVHCPERIIPGNMVYELVHNSRTIGADNREIAEIVKEMYSIFCKGNIVITDIKTAEMTKVVENTFRDINIAFANELVKIADAADMDVYEIIRIANMHPRVNILQPGPGVGGHCISVDPWFLVGDYPGIAKLIWQARLINDSMPEYVLNKIAKILEENNLTSDRVGLYGLTYKPNVDDTRESPTLQLLEKQKMHLANPLKCYDPWIENNIVENQYHDFDEFLANVDVVVIMQKHSHIVENLDKLEGKIVFDTQNIMSGEKVYKL